MDVDFFVVQASAAVVASYLIGSLSFAVIVSRMMGLQDPRTYGSQNPGATNVLRSGSKAAAVLTLLLDAVKGWLPVFLVQRLPGMDLDAVIAACALAAFAGHVWPVFFRFKGGKGVATAAGVLFGLEPWLGLATMATWLIVAYFSRYSSLAAVAAAVFAPAFYLLGAKVVWSGAPVIALSIGAMCAVLLYRHKDNIARLIAGKEARIGTKSA
jgi:glycerol-3-phosphate acyltransferase PlsY